MSSVEELKDQEDQLRVCLEQGVVYYEGAKQEMQLPSLEQRKKLQKEADEAEEAAYGSVQQEIYTANRELVTAQRSFKSALSDVTLLEQRIAEHEKYIRSKKEELERKQRQEVPISMASKTPHPHRRPEAETNPLVSLSPMEIQKLRERVETDESRVIFLREKHSKLHQQLKHVSSELNMLKPKHIHMKDELVQLEAMNLHHAAAEASHPIQEAKTLVATYNQKTAEEQRLRADIEEEKSGKQSMMQHLLSGTRQRHVNLRQLRTKLLTSGKSCEASRETLEAAIEQNNNLRENLVSVFYTSEAEMDALDAYWNVLVQRVDEATDKLHRMAYENEIKDIATDYGL